MDVSPKKLLFSTILRSSCMCSCKSLREKVAFLLKTIPLKICRRWHFGVSLSFTVHLRGNASLSGFLYKNYYNDNNNQSRSAATWLPILVVFLLHVKISQFNYIFPFVSIIVLKPNSTGSLLVKIWCLFTFVLFLGKPAFLVGWTSAQQ